AAYDVRPPRIAVPLSRLAVAVIIGLAAFGVVFVVVAWIAFRSRRRLQTANEALRQARNESEQRAEELARRTQQLEAANEELARRTQQLESANKELERSRGGLELYANLI